MKKIDTLIPDLSGTSTPTCHIVDRPKDNGAYVGQVKQVLEGIGALVESLEITVQNWDTLSSTGNRTDTRTIYDTGLFKIDSQMKEKNPVETKLNEKMHKSKKYQFPDIKTEMIVETDIGRNNALISKTELKQDVKIVVEKIKKVKKIKKHYLDTSTDIMAKGKTEETRNMKTNVLTDNETDTKTGFKTDLPTNLQANIQAGANWELKTDIKTDPQKGCKKYFLLDVPEVPGICAINILTLFTCA